MPDVPFVEAPFVSDPQIDADYDTSRQVSDGAALLETRRRDSALARAALACEAGIRYGEQPEETLDVFPAANPGAPIVVFIHGGYWSTPVLVKELYTWVALGLHPHGVTTVVLDYGTCPERELPELTMQCRRALAWVYRHAQAIHGRSDQIYVTGHSAGGHLAARLAQTDWSTGFGLPGNLVRGAAPISGLFDLSPFPRSWLQPKLRLTPDTVHSESPLHVLSGQIAPMLIAWGALETPVFEQQARAWEQACLHHQGQAQLLPLVGCSHNSAIDGLAQPDSPLTLALMAHLRLCLAG